MSMQASSMSIKALAKLTLTLEILDSREDGYNNLNAFTVFLSDMADSVTVFHSPADPNHEEKITIANHEALVDGQNNLAVKALTAFMRNERIASFAEAGEMRIELEKVIPIAAGLGGGSADAAATLNVLNRYFSDQLTISELLFIAAELGSDIPACIYSQALIMRGRGELIDVVDDFDSNNVVALIITPNTECPTKNVYEHYEKIGRPKDTGVKAPTGIEKFVPVFINDLSLAAFDLFPELLDLRNHMDDLTSMRFCLAGSGSTLFSIGDIEQINKSYETIGENLDISQFRACKISGII